MQKDRSYHEAAIKYNEDIAVFAEALAEELDHEEVKRWPAAVAKQHRFHLKRHRSALAKLERKEALENAEPVDVEADIQVQMALGPDEIIEDPEVVEAITPKDTELAGLTDGCEGKFHDPIGNPKCDFNPNKEA